MKQQYPFICKHCQHTLLMPRSGMTLKEARSWFKYMTCPACKREVRVMEKLPPPVVPTYTQPPLWEGGWEDGQPAR